MVKSVCKKGKIAVLAWIVWTFLTKDRNNNYDSMSERLKSRDNKGQLKNQQKRDICFEWRDSVIIYIFVFRLEF